MLTSTSIYDGHYAVMRIYTKHYSSNICKLHENDTLSQLKNDLLGNSFIFFWNLAQLIKKVSYIYAYICTYTRKISLIIKPIKLFSLLT